MFLCHYIKGKNLNSMIFFLTLTGELGGADRWAWPHPQLGLLLEVLLQVLQPVEDALLLSGHHLLLMLHHDGLGLLLCHDRLLPHLDLHTNDPCLRDQPGSHEQGLQHHHPQHLRPSDGIIWQMFLSICKVILLELNSDFCLDSAAGKRLTIQRIML